jgi:dTDP-4-amino-4,6-dideoxygalactose transaminase/predicted glycosyltransferase
VGLGRSCLLEGAHESSAKKEDNVALSSDNGVPFLDLVTPHLEMEEELVTVFRGALKTAGFIGGPVVDGFERQFADICGTEHCVGVASGTDALRFALTAAGVQPGDMVVTVPNTFIATTEAISQAGARPDFVDIDARTYNMDPAKLEDYLERQCTLDGTTGRRVNRKTGRPVTAVVPVHLYGQMAEMDRIAEIAAHYNLVLIEDACQAHGAEYFSGRENGWVRAGSVGRAAAFSFYPGKNLGACGEAGAVTTSDAAIAEHVRRLRDHGQVKKYHHDVEGYNGRLDAIQAGILSAKLRRLPDWTRQRRENARRYGELFGSAPEGLTLPFESDRSRAVYHLYVIQVDDRNDLQAHLSKSNIATLIHYPTPLHLQKPYRNLGYEPGDFPVAEAAASRILSLPMYPHLELEQQRRVVEAVVEGVAGRPRTGTPADQAPVGAAAAARPLHATPAGAMAMADAGKIWIDLDNSPHVPFFAPIIEELQRRGHPIVLTARDCFQVQALADLFRLNYTLIGRHFGKNKACKLAGLGVRSAQLIPTVLRERPRLAVSHWSRSQLVVSTALGVPSLLIGDYEFATPSVLIRPTWLMCPDVIPRSSLKWDDPQRILQYPGIKEDVYVPRFVPDPGIRFQLGLQERDVVVTLRPPAREAHYHHQESDELFDAAVEFLRRKTDVRLVVLPRNARQGASLRTQWPDLFASGKMLIPEHVVDGLNLIWHSDLVISGGGTMNREAAALGVPVYSIFRGQIGAVDRYLSAKGRLVLLESVRDVQTRIDAVARTRPAKPQDADTTTLRSIVDQIGAVMDSTRRPVPSPYRLLGSTRSAL